MKRTAFLASVSLLLAAVTAHASFAQSNQWAWMGGSKQPNVSGVYGTPRTPAAANLPGSRYGSATWVDGQGNLWLFGGFGYDSAGDLGYLDDLWKLDLANNQWAWMAGGSKYNQAGVYGTLQTPALGNTPGSRMQPAFWADSKGRLWLFGGSGADSADDYGGLNDLWEFDPSINQWAWVGGNSTLPAGAHGFAGVYGTLGVVAAANLPGSRSGSITWTDSQGNFWLFGGTGFDSEGQSGGLNDLWEFSPVTNEWTWVNGSNTNGQLGVYGTLGTPSAANVPGARNSAVGWIDHSGNLWLFGGDSTVAGPTGNFLDDLWRFNPTTGQWTWMAGSSTGSYGTYGEWMTPASADSPGSRYGAAGWTDSTGNLWLLGGRGYSSSNLVGNLNDLWEYNPSTNQWAWIGGSSTTVEDGGDFGDLGIFSFSNIPGSRNSAPAWSDTNGNFWLLGGAYREPDGNQGELSDLWEYASTPQGAPLAASPTFSPSSGPLSALQTVSLSDSTPGAVVYYSANSAPPTQYTGPITFSSTESITVIAIASASGYATSQPASAAFTIPLAATPGFSLAPRTFSTAQTLTLTDSTPNATIYYTTDGSTPTSNSPQYSGPVTISQSTTVQAMAAATGYANSDGAANIYNIWPASALNEWAWMGPPLQNNLPPGVDTASWGTLGTPSIQNIPGRRQRPAQWTDAAGNFWMFSGVGIDANDQLNSYLNDLWEFNPATSEWTWMGGSSTAGTKLGQPGFYGTLGAPSPANIPGGREGAGSWTDSSGNFWLFGGAGFDAANSAGWLNDLWEYQLSNKEWIWIAGNSTVTGNACTKVDATEFCGGGAGVYGTLGTPAAGNEPAGRESPTTWFDASGNLWLFGGLGVDPNGGPDGSHYFFSDLWEFNLSRGEWAWMGGSNSDTESDCTSDPNSFLTDCGQAGKYGTLGAPSTANVPGGRSGASGWVDSQGNFWLFGGVGMDANGAFSTLNDLWEFQPPTAKWTWIGGSSTTQPNGAPSLGVYGTLGVPAAGNIPEGRSHAPSWIDKNGNFWLFAGNESTDLWSLGVGQNGTADLWEFNPSANEWAWMGGSSGSDDFGAEVYGTIGTPAAGNIPSSRFGSATWTDSRGNFWLFGGQGFNILNDDWEYMPSAPTAVLPPNFSLSSTASTLTINSGSQGSLTLTVTPQNGFNAAVTFACSGLPTSATCSFSPSSITPSGSAITTQLTIAASASASAQRLGPNPFLPAAGLALAGCLFAFTRRRALRLWLLPLAAIAIFGALTACGGGSNSGGGGGGGGGIQPTTATVTVTATSGTLQQSAKVTLTIN